ncbi:hypothetical protein D918_05361 [Trichuris suis]|nr:hypothetical protein D918_05361 [Trichuris suis]
MCSRYYRAPELVMGNTKYTESVGSKESRLMIRFLPDLNSKFRYFMRSQLSAISSQVINSDVWAAGCVLAECFTCSPIFPGRKDHQLGAICAILGNPPVNVLRILQPNLRRVRLKRRQAVTLPTVMGIPKDHLAILLLEQILLYEPLKRLTAWQVCAHDFFEELLEGNGISMKFKFTQSGLLTERVHLWSVALNCIRSAKYFVIFESSLFPAHGTQYARVHGTMIDKLIAAQFTGSNEQC